MHRVWNWNFDVLEPYNYDTEGHHTCPKNSPVSTWNKSLCFTAERKYTIVVEIIFISSKYNDVISVYYNMQQLSTISLEIKNFILSFQSNISLKLELEKNVASIKNNLL